MLSSNVSSFHLSVDPGSSFKSKIHASTTSTLSFLLHITGPEGATLNDLARTSGIVDYDVVPVVKPGIGEDSANVTGSQSFKTESTKTRRSKYEKAGITRTVSWSPSLDASVQEKKKESKAERKKRIEAATLRAKNWALKRRKRNE